MFSSIISKLGRKCVPGTEALARYYCALREEHRSEDFLILYDLIIQVIYFVQIEKYFFIDVKK